MEGIATLDKQNLFVAWIGLTASGYDLADKNDPEIQHLVRVLKANDFSKHAIQYFSNARTDRYAVNPYWPRGSCITAASFFINEDNEWQSIGNYLAFEKSANTNREFENPDFIEWISQLPDFLKAIQAHKAYQVIYSAYQQILGARSLAYSSVLVETERRMEVFNENSRNEGRVVFVPNLLQSPFVADNVYKDDTVFVVTTRPEISTLIHEYLHQFIGEHRNWLKGLINKTDFNLFADIQKMAAYGYMWDESIEAKIRVLEESAVRAISIVLASHDTNEAMKMGNRQRSDGFLLVPAVIEHAQNQLPTKYNLAEFLSDSFTTHIAKEKTKTHH